MATTIKLVNQFADETTRTLELGPVNINGAALDDVKANIKAINSDSSTFAAYYVSDGGASFTKIANAYVITEKTTNINIE